MEPEQGFLVKISVVARANYVQMKVDFLVSYIFHHIRPYLQLDPPRWVL
jgi:hypothetical protein